MGGIVNLCAMGNIADGPKFDAAPPPRGEVAQVLCGGLKHLAYRDWRGNWRSLLDAKPLKGEVRVINLPTEPRGGHIQLNLFR